MANTFLEGTPHEGGVLIGAVGTFIRRADVQSSRGLSLGITSSIGGSPCINKFDSSMRACVCVCVRGP